MVRVSQNAIPYILKSQFVISNKGTPLLGVESKFQQQDKEITLKINEFALYTRNTMF